MEESLGQLLPRALRKMGVRNQVRNSQIGGVFSESVGPALSQVCRVERLERNTLVIASSNSVLNHQLQLDSVKLMAAINSRLGEDVVRRLRFVTLSDSAAGAST